MLGSSRAPECDVVVDAPVQGGFSVAHLLSFVDADENDLTVNNSGPLQFSGNSAGEIQTIEVTINGDTIVEPDETLGSKDKTVVRIGRN